jgi:hypothetical protein
LTLIAFVLAAAAVAWSEEGDPRGTDAARVPGKRRDQSTPSAATTAPAPSAPGTFIW